MRTVIEPGPGTPCEQIENVRTVSPTRDDFRQSTKNTLARRVGYLCSNPNCRRHTIGPAAGHPGSTNIGIAAHITAASVGGPRYDETLTRDERRSADNGIWCCQNCAHLVDADDSAYSEETLRSWKRAAESRAASNIAAAPADVDGVPTVLDIQLVVDGVGRYFTGGDEVREVLLELCDHTTRDRHNESRRRTASEQAAWVAYHSLLGHGQTGPPPTAEETEQLIADRQATITRKWPRIEHYVGGMTWPSLRFVVTNYTSDYLRDVKLVVSFAGAVGVEKQDLSDFAIDVLFDPDYEEPVSMYSAAAAVLIPKPANYPVSWRNGDAGLEVRIDLAELPPGEAFAWDSREYHDVVLAAKADVSLIPVTWVAVAPGYGPPTPGAGIELGVEDEPMLETVAQLFEDISAEA